MWAQGKVYFVDARSGAAIATEQIHKKGNKVPFFIQCLSHLREHPALVGIEEESSSVVFLMTLLQN